jgi:very-short-patch-repair endonuclease
MDTKVPTLRDRARQLRRNQTNVEGKLWSRLRARQLSDAKFRRQYPIGAFIADFCCYERRLVIELDGGHHAEHVDADQSRTDFFVSQGYRVLRFWNNEVIENIDGVLEKIGCSFENPKSKIENPK